MLIQSQDLYDNILTEMPIDYKQNLVQVTKYQDGQNCPIIEDLKLSILFILILLIFALENSNPQW